MSIHDNGDGTLTRRGLPEAAKKMLGLDPYGVPTGVVPRVSGYLRVDTSMKIKGAPLPPLRPEDEVRIKQLQADIRAGGELAALGPFDPIAKAVDDYLEMARKAKAWDTLMLTTARTKG